MRSKVKSEGSRRTLRDSEDSGGLERCRNGSERIGKDRESPYITPPPGSSDPTRHLPMTGRQYSQSAPCVFGGEPQGVQNRTSSPVEESGRLWQVPSCCVHSYSLSTGRGIEVAPEIYGCRVWLRLHTAALRQPGQDLEVDHSIVLESDPEVQASV